MNRSYLAGLALAFAAMQPGMAAPLAYNINFTTTSGTAPTSGGFTYDAMTTTFSAFTVVWNTITFDFTSTANSPMNMPIIPCNGTGPSAAFALLTKSDGCITPEWFSFLDRGIGQFDFTESGVGGPGHALRYFLSSDDRRSASSVGTYGVAPANATPEPNSIIAAATGLLAMGLLTHNRRSRPARPTIATYPPNRESR